jgi:DNA-binding transcriptional regulator YbjK
MNGTRRVDPGRRDRILDATLDVVADHGVAGTSHRRVAAAADVPLGSMTYHFDGMESLLHEAFTRFAQDSSAQFRARLDAAASWQEARDAILKIIGDLNAATTRSLVITHELYTLAAREPAYRDITHEWMARDRQTFARHFDDTTSRLLNALIEGLVLHRALDTEPHDPTVDITGVDRILANT